MRQRNLCPNHTHLNEIQLLALPFCEVFRNTDNSMLKRDQDNWADNVSSKELFSVHMHADYHGTNVAVKMAL